MKQKIIISGGLFLAVYHNAMGNNEGYSDTGYAKNHINNDVVNRRCLVLLQLYRGLFLYRKLFHFMDNGIGNVLMTGGGRVHIQRGDIGQFEVFVLEAGH